jgi:hypothetical protein
MVRAGRAYRTGSIGGDLIPSAGRSCYGPRPLPLVPFPAFA